MPSIVVIGLDSVPPELIFERFLPVMPNFRGLLARSRWGALRTCEPPITVPAWAVLFGGVDPGTLGVYGFRHRRPGTYFDQYTPTPSTLRSPMLWDLLSRRGKRVAVVGMPPGYPPPTVNGVYVSDFLTPDGASDVVTPASLRPELERVGGTPLTFDVEFRHDARERLFDELTAMTRQKWAIAREVYRRGPWDLFAFHDIGPDRFHHAFWKYFDPAHPRHDPKGPFLDVGERYYRALDAELGAFLAGLAPETVVLVCSDHGSMAMKGCFCINEWLIAEGYLRLKGPPPPPNTPLETCTIDWKHTSVWGAGGYYARLFFNVKGREPEGSIRASGVPKLTEQLLGKLEKVRLPSGSPLGVRVTRPADAYREVRGDAPDLMAYFGDLAWRSAGTVGHGRLFLDENDTGPDDAVHGWDGIYALTDARRGEDRRGRGPRQRLMDVGPTLLRLLGESPPSYMLGTSIPDWNP